MNNAAFYNPPELIQYLNEKIDKAKDYGMQDKMITFVLQNLQSYFLKASLQEKQKNTQAREYLTSQILPSLIGIIKDEVGEDRLKEILTKNRIAFPETIQMTNTASISAQLMNEKDDKKTKDDSLEGIINAPPINASANSLQPQKNGPEQQADKINRDDVKKSPVKPKQ